MPRVFHIREEKKILPYLEARGLLKQYKKAKAYLLRGDALQVAFKERNPQGSGIWYFKINKQYRVLGVLRNDGLLVIFKIDNHQ